VVTTFSTNMGNIAKYISILCIAALPLFLSSCKDNDKEPAKLKDLVSIYGRPEYVENQKFLPVEIFRKDDGWYAHYITRTGKPLADTKLNVRCYDNDTTVVYFDEISDGPAGYYTLNFMDYGHLMYTSSQGEKYDYGVYFYDNSFDVSDIEKALRRIKKMEPDDFHSTEYIADSLKHLIKYNPATLEYPMDSINLSDFWMETQTSPDGKLRIYCIRYYFGGCGHGNHPEMIVAQYNADGNVVFVDDFSFTDYEYEHSYSFPHLYITILGQQDDGCKTLYLIETMTYDEYSDGSIHKILRAYAIENGGLVQKNVFRTATKTLSEIDVRFFDEEKNSFDTAMFRYIPDTKNILVPLLKSDTLKEPVSQYIVYQWDGKYFTYKGTEPATKYKK